MRGRAEAVDFYPRPPRGGRRQLRRHHRPIPRISIHALREEGDAFRPPFWLACPNFYPRPPRGGRPVPRPRMLPQQYFYPRPPRGGRRIAGVVPVNAELFLSTPSARRATDNRAGNQCAGTISIHALREEGDQCGPDGPLGGFGFLSTPSARRATGQRCTLIMDSNDFYPRPPRGGRLLVFFLEALLHDFYPRPPRGGRLNPTNLAAFADRISIHALREEGDAFDLRDAVNGFVFLSTPSARRATPNCGWKVWLQSDFYPRPPRGGRPTTLCFWAGCALFLSTPSARRATRSHGQGSGRGVDFYPRPPRGGRRRCRPM